MKGDEREQAISNFLFPPGFMPHRWRRFPHHNPDLPYHEKGE